MYSLAAYARMIDDPSRMGPNAAALKAALRPGMVVGDLGAGTGVFSLLAYRLGARRVFAVEPNQDAIDVVRLKAQANGVGDQIDIYPEISTRITFPEKADLIISDMRGVLPLAGTNLVATMDARERLLKPGGLIIPQQDFVYAAVAKAFPDSFVAWDRREHGIDLSVVDRLIANAPTRIIPGEISPDDLLTESVLWTHLDYRTLDSANAEATIRARVKRAGKAGGIALWFETTLFGEHGFSTGPGTPDLIYGTAWLPLEHETDLADGDYVEADIRAMFVGDDYVWHWNTTVRDAAGSVRVQMRQSSFHARPLTLRRLRKQSHSFKPQLNEDGRVQRFLLDAFSQGLPLGEVARSLQQEFPGRFKTWKDALAAAFREAQRFSE